MSSINYTYRGFEMYIAVGGGSGWFKEDGYDGPGIMGEIAFPCDLLLTQEEFQEYEKRQVTGTPPERFENWQEYENYMSGGWTPIFTKKVRMEGKADEDWKVESREMEKELATRVDLFLKRMEDRKEYLSQEATNQVGELEKLMGEIGDLSNMKRNDKGQLDN